MENGKQMHKPASKNKKNHYHNSNNYDLIHLNQFHKFYYRYHERAAEEYLINI